MFLLILHGFCRLLIYFSQNSINVFDCHLSGMNMLMSFLPDSTLGQCQRSTLILKLVMIHFCVFGNFAWFLSSVDIFFSK